MDQQIRKLQGYLDLYLGKSSEYILQELGLPDSHFENNKIWFYKKKSKIIFKDDIIFFLKDEKVVEIAITEYIMGIAVRNIFYNQKGYPKFKISNILLKFTYEA